jgi:hypothetical protein
MDLNEAVAILKRRTPGSMHEQVAAGAYVHSYYTHEGAHLTKPLFTTDAIAVGGGTMPKRSETSREYVARMATAEQRYRRTRDEGYAESMQGRSSQTEMGHGPNQPDKLAGAVIVARMRGPSSAYSIIDDNGDAVVLYHGSVEGVMDPGQGLTQDRREILDRIKREQTRNRMWADNITSFWQRQRSNAA